MIRCIAVGVFCTYYLSCMFLCRENEVLKVQLKKYVGAVQMLKREGSQGNDGKQHTHTRTHARTCPRHQYDLKLDFISVSQCSEKHAQEKRSSVSFTSQSWCVSQTTNLPFNSVNPCQKAREPATPLSPRLVTFYLCLFLCRRRMEVASDRETNAMLVANTINTVDHGGSYNG